MGTGRIKNEGNTLEDAKQKIMERIYEEMKIKDVWKKLKKEMEN